MKNYCQFVRVILTNGEHSSKTYTFIPCSQSGLTEDEIITFLQDYHNVKEQPSSDGLDQGFYWTYADTAAGVFAVDGQNINNATTSLFKLGSQELALIQQFAPQLISH